MTYTIDKMIHNQIYLNPTSAQVHKVVASTGWTPIFVVRHCPNDQLGTPTRFYQRRRSPQVHRRIRFCLALREVCQPTYTPEIPRYRAWCPMNSSFTITALPPIAQQVSGTNITVYIPIWCVLRNVCPGSESTREDILNETPWFYGVRNAQVYVSPPV